jgi:hypothetical protein
MTKLQTIEAEIQTLPVDEQRELISKFAYLVTPSEDDIFELTETELAEIDDLLINDTETFTLEEVMDSLKEKYATDIGPQ